MTIDKKSIRTGKLSTEKNKSAEVGASEGGSPRPAPQAKKNGFLILCFLALLAYSIFENGGLINYIQLQKELNATNNDIKTAQATIARLRQEVDILKTDKRYLESLAREDFGLVRKDEVIYQFPAPPPSK